MNSRATPAAVSFDLFGTLVAVDPPRNPAAAVASELVDRGVPVPDDWRDAYAEPHVDAPDGAEVSLPEHAAAALASRDVDTSREVVGRAVRDAFDAPVRVRDGARAALDAAEARGPVGVLSNCSVPGLVERTLDRSSLDRDRFDAVVTSVDCGWRKPDECAFAAAADALGVPPEALRHVGDDPSTDGGAESAGAASVLVDDVPLTELPATLEGSQ